jgi:hypothetical protein
VNQRLCLALVWGCLLALVPACGKSKSGASPGAPSAAGVAAAPSADQVAATIAELTQAVRKFAVEQRQAPKSLDELVAKGYLDRIPAAPKGKEFAIDKNLQVRLANR